MGMSTHIVGFRAADTQWDVMKEIYNKCKMANVTIPKEVSVFFNHENPNGMPGMEIPISDALSEYSGSAVSGWTVDLKKLPPDVRFVRFYNSH